MSEILDTTSADITSWSFVPGGPTMSLGRLGMISVVPLQNSAHFLFVGGMDSRGNSMKTTEVLNVNTMSFELGPVMRTRRFGGAAAALDDHRIIVLVGSSTEQILSSSEVITINNDDAGDEL